MIEKRILCYERVRRIGSSFAFIEHRFLRDGFLASLDHNELLLYLFLVLAADRYGISFYGYDRMCSILRLSVEEYLEARNHLIDKDLIAFDGTLFQVLSLPEKPVSTIKVFSKPQRTWKEPIQPPFTSIFAKTFGERP